MPIILFIISVVVLSSWTFVIIRDNCKYHKQSREQTIVIAEMQYQLTNTQSRLESTIKKLYETGDVAYKAAKECKRLTDDIARLETQMETFVVPCTKGDEQPPHKRYTESEREQAVAFYETHKAEGMTKAQAARQLGIRYETYKKWFR
ncbi:MAG: hypothetical protein NC229_08890 [Bacteroides sp.]|nr:hypothetical protein [Bacteroides sp.]MCM1577136.1 hypothetical protein [Bacteroides sp.]